MGAAQSIDTMMRLHRQSGRIEIGADCSLLDDGVGSSSMVLSHRWRYAPVVTCLLRSGLDTLPAGLVLVARMWAMRAIVNRQQLEAAD